MEKLNQTPSREDRKHTDNSLTRERVKTDESLEGEREKAAIGTDQKVESDRLDADQAKQQHRDEEDSKRDSDRADSDPIENHETAERRIRTQRQFEDKAIESERSSVDAAIVRERGATDSLMNDRFSQERKATDKNLMGERTQNDIEVQQATVLLNAEQDAHSDTKTALTTREEFLAIVSHDLKNPIGAISSCTEILSEDPTFVNFSEEVKQWIRFVKRNADTSLRLISDILDMERFSEGKLQLQLAPHSINDLIKEAAETYSHVAVENEIELKVNPANVASVVVCDKDRIAQVLSNLIANALKFTPKGGSVLVSADETKSEIKVSVSDTGPGIPEQQKSHIFDRFAQLQNKDRSGLGLGLYISKTLVEAHQGRLWVKSTPGEGSTFSFTIPKL